jgi:hypothetical protein
MATEKHRATAKEYFDSHPGESVVHFTSDGQAFFQRNHNDAVNHQRRVNSAEALVSVYKNKKGNEDSEDDSKGGNDDAGKLKVVKPLKTVDKDKKSGKSPASVDSNKSKFKAKLEDAMKSKDAGTKSKFMGKVEDLMKSSEAKGKEAKTDSKTGKADVAKKESKAVEAPKAEDLKAVETPAAPSTEGK